MVHHTKPHLILHESTVINKSLIQHFSVASVVFQLQQAQNGVLTVTSFLGLLCIEFYEEVIYESPQYFYTIL